MSKNRNRLIFKEEDLRRKGLWIDSDQGFNGPRTRRAAMKAHGTVMNSTDSPGNQYFKQMFMEAHENAPFLVLLITPVGYVRQTGRDAYRPSKAAKRYHEYCDRLRALAGEKQYVVTERMNVKFFLPIPKTRKKGKNKVSEGDIYKQKPDGDNLMKALLDALTNERYVYRKTTGDQHVWDGRYRKYYSETPRIEIHAPQD